MSDRMTMDVPIHHECDMCNQFVNDPYVYKGKYLCKFHYWRKRGLEHTDRIENEYKELQKLLQGFRDS